MIQRFATGIFTRDYKKTIGVDFLEKVLAVKFLEYWIELQSHAIRVLLHCRVKH